MKLELTTVEVGRVLIAINKAQQSYKTHMNSAINANDYALLEIATHEYNLLDTIREKIKNALIAEERSTNVKWKKKSR